MKKLLNYLTFGHHIVVDELTGWGNESNISGFTIGELRAGENILIAPNGSRLTISGNKLRRGNTLTASLQRNDNEIEKVIIGDCCEAYQGLPIVIATAGDNVQIIAPVCKTSAQLLQFLTEVKDFCKERKDVPWWFYGKTEKLANWLYYNNPYSDLCE